MTTSARTWIPGIAVLLLAAAHLPDAAAGPGYASFPTIGQNEVAFTCEGDLWSVPLAGGLARRLTRDAGLETMAWFAPGGRRLAFSADYQGNQDVYVIPAEGGSPLRLTFHPGPDQVVGWTPDGSSVLFRSRRASGLGEYELFAVAAEGGLPRRLPLGTAARASFAADGNRVAFTRFSREFRTWKRYTGGWNEDIWVADLAAQQFARITDYRGTDAQPLWIGERIYFVSDRDGTGNLYSMKPDGTDLVQHTRHEEFDVRSPAAGAGGLIAYQLGADVRVFDPVSGEDRLLAIELPSDRSRTQPRHASAADYLQGFELSPDGKQLLLEARGDLALVPVREARVIEIAASSGVREREARWTRDGRSVAFLSDAGGEERLMVAPAADGTAARVAAELPPGWHHAPAWSPDGTWIALGDMTGALRVVRIEDGRVTDVDRSQRGEIRDYAWSPDSRYLAYSRLELNGFGSIYIHDSKNGEKIRVTGDFTDDVEPVWDPEGRYLYFLSNRTVDPMVANAFEYEAILAETAKPYVVLLKAGEKSPFLPRLVDEQEEPRWDRNGHDGEDGDGGNGDEHGRRDRDGKGEEDGARGRRPGRERPGEEEWRKVEVTLDPEDIASRVYAFPVEPGRYEHLAAGKKRVYFLATPADTVYPDPPLEEPAPLPNDLLVYDLEERKLETLAGEIDGYDLAAGGDKLALRRRSKIEVRDAKMKDWGGPRREPESVDLARWHIRIDPPAEWRQIFDEAWRRQRDFFWAADMCRIEWRGLHERYAALLPRIATRQELTDLIGQLIGELGNSHTYIWGGDQLRANPVPVGLLGADLEDSGQGYYRFSKVLAGENWDPRSVSPLTLSHVRVRAGDYLIAVNGRELHPPESPFARLEFWAGEAVRLTVSDKPSPKGARDVVIETLEDDTQLRYLDWVETNRGRVERAGGGRVGYLHIPDMSGQGLHEFMRSFFPQTEREALVIDVRSNGGGSVSQLVLKRLMSEIVAYFKPRHQLSERYPYRAFRGPMVVLCDERCGSDGDIFTRSFQLLGLGKVVGKRTWGGVVGIRMDKRFVDGGAMSEPEFAWWTPEEGWGLENRGTIPDIEVDLDPASEVAGRDPQLDKAIEVVLAELAETPPEPQPPASPDKSKEGFRARTDLYHE